MALLLPALSAPAQQPTQQQAQPPAGSNWQHVQALPIGASINVKARTSHLACKLKSVDADTLTCTHGKDIVFQSSEILSIKVPHRGRSTLVGLAIGGGAGSAIGFGVGTNSSNGFLGPNFMRGAVTAVFGVGGGIIGGLIGGTTDFTKSTVYKTP
jgi:hypothetical protein